MTEVNHTVDPWLPIMALSKRIRILGSVFLLIAFLTTARDLEAQDSAQRFSLHFQLTTITQQHTGFTAPYEGPKSLRQDEHAATSMTATLFAGLRISKHTELYLNSEMAGGTGLSGATGVAGFTNGETFRVGDPRPVIIMARFFIRHIIPLSDRSEWRDEAANNLRVRVPIRYLAFHLGKISLADYFDYNGYSHDPREHFLNWALMSAGAWDYAADVRGYTWGAVGEWVTPKWEARIATALLPKEANGAKLNWNYGKSFSWQAEVVRHWGKDDHAAIRALVFYNYGPMGSYQKAMLASPPDLIVTRKNGRSNFGWGLNLEQPINENSGVFGRISWNQGKTETWCFTEIDRSLTYGYVLKGNKWRRSSDALGIAMIHNGISRDHQDFLAIGGAGFMVGDGKIRYGMENILETYYKFDLLHGRIMISPDYQLVLNPAYNKDRGPVHFFGIRFHTQW